MKKLLLFFFISHSIQLCYAQYRLPFPAGNTYTCTQGNNGSKSHFNKESYAFDFSMPIGSNIVAMRSGTVTHVVQSYSDNNCTNLDCAGSVNRIVIQHEDKTKALYLHITKNGSSVKVGEYVMRGQIIARSGNTGYSTKPHLHIMLMNDCSSEWYCQSIPLKFDDVTTDNGIPQPNKSYQSNNTELIPPSIPTLFTPAQNANNVSIKNGISFKWSSTNADKYRIQIIEASKFVSLSPATGFTTCTNCGDYTNEVTSASLFLWTKAESGKTYYWTVRASGVGGVSNFSDYSKFTTETLTATPPTITGTTTICKGASTTLTSNGCNGIVTWSHNKTGTSVSVSPIGTTSYTATCTVNNVKSANSNTVTVTVNNVPSAPTLTASASTISAGQSTTLTATNCNGTITWDNNQGTGTTKKVSPQTNTTYKATCSNNNCVSVVSTITINVNNPPTITGTATICKGASTTLTANGCNGIVTWSHNKTGTSVSVSPIGTTSYTATCTVNAIKSANSNAVTVTVNPVPSAPTLTASASTISAGQSTTLTATNCNGTITWDNNQGTGTTKKVSPQTNTTYKATCSNNNCVSVASTITINVNNPPTITGTATICKGASTTLTANGCNGIVTWSHNKTGTSVSVSPIGTTSYTATCTVNNVKSANSNTVTVTVNTVPSAPTLTASVSTISAGQSTTLTATNCNGTITWDNNQGTGTTKKVSPQTNTTYKATCSNNNCVSVASTITINVNNPPTITGTATICKGTSTTLTATGCNGIVNWSDNQTGTTVSVKPPATTTYTATCTVNAIKSANSNAVTVTVNPVPNSPKLTASLTTISAGKSATLTASGCTGIVNWDNSLGTGTSKTVTPKATTTYKATCSNNNCVSSALAITITVKNTKSRISIDTLATNSIDFSSLEQSVQRIFPNPVFTGDEVNFDKPISFTLLDQYNNVIAVQQEKVSKWNVKNLSNGFYIVRTDDGGSLKLIIIR